MTDTPFRALDWLLLLASALIWGASFLFMAIGLEVFAPGVVTFLRVATGAVVLSAFPRARRPIEPQDRRAVFILSISWLAFPLTLFPIAQQWVDSSLAGMLNAAMPVATVAISWLLFHTPTSARRMLSVVIGLVGVLMIGVPEATTSNTKAIGVALLVVAVASYGVAINLAIPLQRKYGSLPVLSRALWISTALVIPYALVGLPESSFAWGPFWACLVLGAGGSGFALVFASILAARVGAVRASMTTYVVPIVATFLGVIFRDENIGVLAVAGTAVVLTGAWMSTRGR